MCDEKTVFGNIFVIDRVLDLVFDLSAILAKVSSQHLSENVDGP